MESLKYSVATLMVLFLWAPKVEAQTSSVTVALVVQEASATVDTATTLPVSASGFAVGSSVFVEVWATTQDPNGLSQVSADISFDANQLAALTITPSAAFSLFPNGTIDNVAGLIDDLSGSVLPASPPCSSQLGVGGWTRVAEVEMVVLATPAGVLQTSATGSPIFVVAVCGAFVPPQVEYLGVDLNAVDTAQIELVTLAVPSGSDVAASLPTSQTEFVKGDLFVVELWAQTSSGRGFSQVSADILFNSSVVSAVGITHTATFSLFPSGTIDNPGGLIDDLSGSVPSESPPCSSQVGTEPSWARVGIVEMSADTVGTQTFQALDSGNPIFVVATCGDFSAPVSAYGQASVNVLCRPAAEAVALGPLPQPKSRYLSIVPGNPGMEVGVRVTFVDVNGFPSANGSTLWVGPPQDYPEEDSSQPGRTFIGARLQCEPYFRDWGTIDLLHVFGAEVIPSSSIALHAVSQGCYATLGDSADFGVATTMTTSKWADIVTPFFVNPGDIQPDFKDISAVVAKFLGDPDAPIKAASQMQPNIVFPSRSVDFKDISSAVSSFLGGDYSNGLGITGPCVCPSPIVCGAQACAVDNDCGAGFCINGFCTDSCGRCAP